MKLQRALASAVALSACTAQPLPPSSAPVAPPSEQPKTPATQASTYDVKVEEAVSRFSQFSLASIAGVDPSRKLSMLLREWSELHGCGLCTTELDLLNREEFNLVLQKVTSAPGFLCVGASASLLSAGPPWTQLVQKCGAAHFHLPKGREFLLTPHWSLLSHLSASVQEARTKTPAHVLLRLDDPKSFDPLNLLVPLVGEVAGSYSLAKASGAEPTEPAYADYYLLLNQEGLFMDAWPNVTFIPSGLVWSEAAQGWPGTKTTPGTLLATSKIFFERDGYVSQKEEDFLMDPSKRPPPSGETKLEPTPDWLKGDGKKGTKKAGLFAMKGPTGRLGAKAPFLLFVDQALPLAPLLEVLQVSPWANLSLAVSGEGQLASEHPHELYAADPKKVERKGVLLRLTKEGCRIFTKKKSRLFSLNDLAAFTKTFNDEYRAATDANEDELVIIVDEGLLTSDLISILNVIEGDVPIALLGNQSLPSKSPLYYKQ